MEWLLTLPSFSYCAELAFAMVLFWAALEKQKYCFVRLAGGMLLLLGESLWIGPWLQRKGIHIWFFLVFFTLLLTCLISCKITAREGLYCLACGYLTQHFASSCYLFLSQMGWAPADRFWNRLLYLGIYFAVYVSFYFLFARGMTENGHYPVNRATVVVVVAAMVLIVYCMSVFTKQLASFMHIDTNNQSYQIMLGICQLYAMFTCFLFLLVQRMQRKEMLAWRALEENKAIWNQRKLQYQLSRENMEMMNRKFHDMKHQIAALSWTGCNSVQRDAFVEELQKMVRIYGSDIDTGNEALDAILMEKSLYCSVHGIQWNCVADGTFLSFMDVVDLYTMLGNALDNAVEAVERAADAEKRLISVRICKEKGFALIQIKNYFEGTLRFQGDLPATSKQDAGEHGYGLRSIQAIAEKYHGTMSVKAEDGFFILNMIIPVYDYENASAKAGLSSLRKG